MKTYYESPIGLLEIYADNTAVLGVSFVAERTSEEEYHPVLSLCTVQLDEYFNGKRKVFQLPLRLNGSVYQQKVWKALSEIPYGTTCSYVQIARNIQSPLSIRSVGQANKKNHIPILIPCHRVINANADIGGYSGGIWRKKWLLEHEQKYASSVA